MDLPPLPDLPVRDALPALMDALSSGRSAVLTAPPGAGKTTLVPLALAAQPWASGGRILMLEPRRVAARAAAERMADLLDEEVGARVGYAIRRERRMSRRTRIEVVTEGILTRMLQSDPSLDGVAAVIFDEFHERSIHADLGLALCLESQAALRDDLRILVMSATLDAGQVAAMLGNAPVVSSEGRMFPVETRWREHPWRGPRAQRDAFERAVAESVTQALAAEPGDVLVFLPGIGEIARVQSLLGEMLAGSIEVQPLHGGLPFARQRAALRPRADCGRRAVLATAIAETSLTIEGVRIVVDGGLSRRPRFDAGAGMTRLVTGRVSKATAEQRRGRAGRLGPGICYRVWTKGEDGALPPRDRPEILDADLAPLMLDLALWGVRDPADLSWLDLPPETAVAQARELLTGLGALDAQGAATAHGKALAAQPMHPRLAHMRLSAEGDGLANAAAELAVLLEERDPLRGAGANLSLRVAALRSPNSYMRDHRGEPDRAALARMREALRALGARNATSPLARTGALIARAYPDRVAQRRPGDAPRFVMANGKGAMLRDGADPLAGEAFLAIAHLDGKPRDAAIRLAAHISRGEIETLFPDRIEEGPICEWDSQSDSVVARWQRRFGALVLEDRKWRDATPEAIAGAALEGVRRLGVQALPWNGAASRLRDRVAWLRQAMPDAVDLPDWSDAALTARLDDWLLPHLGKTRSKAGFAALPLADILLGTLDWRARQALDRLAPDALPTAAGTRARIDYSSAPPALEVRIQEMFGQAEHPSICEGRVKLLIRFLSPARRPVQVTGDLNGFWANSYAEVRKDLRGRYPKHPWPEDPLSAEATARAKPRKR